MRRTDEMIWKKQTMTVTRKTSWICAYPKEVEQEQKEVEGEVARARRETEGDGDGTRHASDSLEFLVRLFKLTARKFTLNETSSSY